MQLRQTVSEFFKHWNLLSKCNSKNIRCSYSFTPAIKKTTMDNNEVYHSKLQSKSSIVRCPFELKWSLVKHKKPYRHDVFYKVKISLVPSTEHTCMMSHISYRHALRKSSGHKK